jgi:parallel beta-helix repeat protein
VVLGRRVNVGGAAAAFLGLCLLTLPWLADLRPPPLPDRAQREYRVTSSGDGGVGSLREAIVAANRAPGRTRIVLPPLGIKIETPLPPLVNPAGIVIQGRSGSEIDAAGLSGGPALDVIAPGSSLQGFHILRAAGQGILVRSPNVQVEDLTLVACGTGLHVLGAARDLSLIGSRFEANAVGVMLEDGVEGVRIVDNVFRAHRRAGLWAVSSRDSGQPGLVVLRNRFEGDAISIVAMNVGARIEDNHISGFGEAGVFLSGRENTLRNNRIRSGRTYGICAVSSEATLIEGNEADHNGAVGILLKNAFSTVVKANRIYANGFGIVVVFGDPIRPSRVAENLVWQQSFDGMYVIGGSPLVTGNQVRTSGGAGIRIDDFEGARGAVRLANPLLTDNVLERNLFDDPKRGRYVE